MNKKITLLLFLVVVIASVLRLWQLGSVPISPDWDEVALGYNGYSIMETGRDEYGTYFPSILRSFDDYKPALYAYLVIPFIKIFDLNIFAVRLPSAILGILTVIVVFYLVKELLDNAISNSSEKKEKVAFLSTFLLAISPWHIQFSRIAFEANVGLACNIFGIYFFLKGLKKPWVLFLSALFMALSIYAYQSEKVFVPLIILALLVVYKDVIRLIPRRYTIGVFILGIIVLLPIIISTVTNPQTLKRAEGVSIFSQNATLEKQIKRFERVKSNNNILGFLFDRREVFYGKKVVENYLSHYDFNWLFIKGDFEVNRHHAPSMGLMYLWEFPFLLLGFYFFAFGFPGLKIGVKTKLFLFLWFLIVPIPASVTMGVPHPIRTLNFLPTFQIFIAFGIIGAYLSLAKAVKNSAVRLAISFFVVGIFLFNFLYYLNQYFVQQNYYSAKDWQYGYKELVDYLKPLHSKYSKVIVSNISPMDQSYMFFLFYLKYDPSLYLSQGGTVSGGFSEENNKFLNFEFRKFNYYEEQKNVLLVGSNSDFPEEFKVIKTIVYPDENVAIKVVEKD